jgi:Tol biopolymer transport system component
MKKFRLVLLAPLFALGLASSALSAESAGWIVVTDSYGESPSIQERIVALRDDGKVRYVLPKIETQDYRIFSPDGKKWLEVVHDQGFSVASSTDYLLVGAKGETDKDKKPLIDNSTGKQLVGNLRIESAAWTPNGNILLSSGHVDWSLGTEMFVYSIVNANSGKDVIDLERLRKGVPWLPEYERDAALSSDESQLIFVARSAAFGSDASLYAPDHNDYLVYFNWKGGSSQTQIVAGFKAILHPQWDPSGTKVIFSACTAWSRDGNSAPSNIYLYLAEGDDLRQFTYSPFVNSSPSWSPDGKRIAWISNRPLKRGGKPDKGYVYTMNADGTNQKLFAGDVNATSIVWQKDEPKVGFQLPPGK